MKIFPGFLAFANLVLPTVAEPVFQGYLVSSEKTGFVLSTANGAKSGWLTIGDEFDGFRLTEFEAKTERLTVEKNGRRLVLPLAESPIHAAAEAGRENSATPVTLSMGDTQSLTIDGRATTEEDLKKIMIELARRNPQPVIVVRAAPTALRMGKRPFCKAPSRRPAAHFDRDTIDVQRATGHG